MNPQPLTSNELRSIWESLSKDEDVPHYTMVVSKEYADMILNMPPPPPYPQRTWKLDKDGNALILVRIKKVFTGEIKERHDYLLFPDWDEKTPTWYIWEEGNFACDCNRAIFFGDEDETCGESRYRVQLINKHDGEAFYSEF